MDWSNDLSLYLIELYRQNELLWNPKHPDHYSRVRKLSAWRSIVKNLGVSELDLDMVQSKMKSLLASYRREKSKVRNSSDSGKKYMPSWFAYPSLHFLPYKSNPTTASNGNVSECEESVGESEFTDIDNIKLESEYEDTEMLQEDNTNADSFVDCDTSNAQAPEQTSSQNPLRVKVKRRKEFNEEDYDRVSRKQFCISGVEPCALYGQHIANKLKSYSRRTRAFVEHAISNILFEADLGKYENRNAIIINSESQNSNE